MKYKVETKQVKNIRVIWNWNQNASKNSPKPPKPTILAEKIKPSDSDNWSQTFVGILATK